MALSHYDVGEPVARQLTFKNAAGALADPTSVFVDVRKPAGTVTIYQYGVDGALTKTKDFLGGLASDKYGGELLPTVISMRELIESFDKKSGQLIAETRKMLGEVSVSVNKAGQKFGGPPPRR